MGFGAMDATKPYELIRFGDMDVTKPYEFIGFEAAEAKTTTTKSGETRATTANQQNAEVSCAGREPPQVTVEPV